jgi:isovaleryl-CoA dehydrogenase
MGMRGSPTAELVFNDCEISVENILGVENGGVGVLMSGLDYERTVLAGIQLGIMQACLDVVVPYVRERKQFGQPIGAFQLMQAKIADMYVALNSARSYVYAVARSCDAGRTTRFDAAGAILLASENAVKVALEAVQALGGAGYTKDWPVERYLRDAKLLDIGAGTNEIRRMLIGRELIGV